MEVGLVHVQLEFGFAVSDPAVDPRGWTISTLFYGEVGEMDGIEPGATESAVQWFPVDCFHLHPNLVPGFAFLIGRLYELWRANR